MKFLFVICSLCVMMVLTEGGVVGSTESTEGSASSAEDNRPCPNSLNSLQENAIDCLIDHENELRVKNLTTIEEFRQFFSNYCQELPPMRKCLSTLLSQSRRCFNQSDQHSHQIYMGILNTSLNLGCANSGETFATISNGMKGSNAPDYVFPRCLETIFPNKKRVELDQPGRILFIYRNINVMKECVMEGIEDDENLRNALGAFFDGLRKEWYCVHPELNSVVLCSSIETV